MTPTATVSDLPQPGRTMVMGVVNVTPDSFSDGGRWFATGDAVAHAGALLAEGADIIDVGGESTRPGARSIDAAEELRRVLPVVSELAALGAVVSIDSMHAEVVRQAVAAGARLVNDVSGGQADPGMLDLVAELGVPYVCMHWRGPAVDMQRRAVYGDVVADVVAELAARLEAAVRAGIRRDHLILDPGFGFAKNADHNWELLRRLGELEALGQPLLVGVSRKTFLGSLLADASGDARPAPERDCATVALTTVLAQRQVWAVRVHAVRPSRDAVAVVQRLQDT